MNGRRLSVALVLVVCLPMFAADGGKVEGKFVVGGADAQLQYVRAKRVKLDEKGKDGYAVLLSARPASGDILAWRTADPKERGSFICVLFEANGKVWVADLGHVKAKSGRFGVVTDLRTAAFSVKDNKLTAHVTTDGDQSFTQDHYDIDLTFAAPLEGQ